MVVTGHMYSTVHTLAEVLGMHGRLIEFLLLKTYPVVAAPFCVHYSIGLFDFLRVFLLGSIFTLRVIVIDTSLCISLLDSFNMFLLNFSQPTNVGFELDRCLLP